MTSIRYRRNINCIGTHELHTLREALTYIFELPPENEDSFERIAGLHGQPSPSYCRHGYPGFLTWHRAYIDIYEKALRCFDRAVTLPFWDWSSGPKFHIDAGWFMQPVKTAKLIMRSTKMPANSGEVRVFLNEPRPATDTVTRGNPHFLGSIGMFGMSIGESDQPMEVITSPADNLDLELDISRPIAELAKPEEEITLTLVPVDFDGRPMSPERMSIEGVDILAE